MAPKNHSQRSKSRRDMNKLFMQSKPYRDLLLDYRKLLIQNNRLEVRNAELEKQNRDLTVELENYREPQAVREVPQRPMVIEDEEKPQAVFAGIDSTDERSAECAPASG